jgi:hypothetical protein
MWKENLCAQKCERVLIEFPGFSRKKGIEVEVEVPQAKPPRKAFGTWPVAPVGPPSQSKIHFITSQYISVQASSDVFRALGRCHHATQLSSSGSSSSDPDDHES